MVLKKDRLYLKMIKIVIISVTVFLIYGVVGYYVLSFMGFTYMKSGEGKKVYEFINDMNGDGKKENVKFVNYYCSYYKKNICDSEYTSNCLAIYLDGKEIYNDTIRTLDPLLNPTIIDLVEKNTIKKQIYVHADGGGPAIPMDYFFYIKDEKVVVSEIESDF